MADISTHGQGPINVNPVSKRDTGYVLRRRINQRLEATRQTMRSASVKAGLGTHFVRDLMEGKSGNPRIDNIERLAKALDVSPEWLLGWDRRDKK